MAHEYLHFIQWSNSPGEQEFIDEGLAELPPALGMFGEDYPGPLVRWSRNPRIALTGWSLDESDRELHYGAALGYAAWLTDTFGVDAAQELLVHPDPGAVGVNGFLRDRGCGCPSTIRTRTSAWPRFWAGRTCTAAVGPWASGAWLRRRSRFGYGRGPPGG